MVNDESWGSRTLIFRVRVVYENGIIVTHGRDVQVNVDIRATRVRFARLMGKTLEVSVKRNIE